MILMCLTILCGFYLIGVVVLLFSFLIKGYNITYTDLKTNKKQQLDGFKKFIACLLMCLIWPVIVIKNGFEE